MKQFIFPTVLFLLSFQSQANTTLPDMQMHIYNAEASPQKNTKAMQMVIFSDDPEMTPSTEMQGENYHLAYTDDGEVSVYSEDESNEDYIDDDNFTFEIYVDAGYRYDNLDWNKANTNGTPNILSELTWDNLEIAAVKLGASVRTPSNWILDARFAYGTIFDGNNQDSDFLGNNRTQEFSRSNNNADEGNTIDASIGFGYRTTIIPAPARFNKPVLSFTPKVGFSYHAQNLTVTDGKQTIAPQLANGTVQLVPVNITFSGLDSNYDTSWYGPWAGFDTELSIADRFSLTTSVEYHYAYYEATAEWNLRFDREQPESFSHRAEGTGLVASIGSAYKFNNDLSIALSVDYQDWRADKKGRTTEFFADGTRSSQKLNEVNWDSLGANIGLKYTF